MKYLIVGLGNIGAEYDDTRHNIGFDIANAFVIKHGGNFELDRHAFVAQCKWKGKQFVVIKPTTYMNLSGKAVRYWLNKEKIDLIVSANASLLKELLPIMDEISVVFKYELINP